MRRAAVFGGTGFVGRAVVEELGKTQFEVTILRAPRLGCSEATLAHGLGAVEAHRVAEVPDLAGYDLVVNAAGLATPTGGDAATLWGANALLPALIARACDAGDVPRLLHVSSAAVQGREALDETMKHAPLTPYARSKAAGEELVLGRRSGMTTILRATSVHGADRTLTQRIARLARSQLSVTASDGSQPTPQVLVEDVGRACAAIAGAPEPPPVALQPWSGMTTAEFLTIMGMGRTPKTINRRVATATLRGARAFARTAGAQANARRLELLLFGQPQVRGWLAEASPGGWDTRAEWHRLAATCSVQSKVQA